MKVLNGIKRIEVGGCASYYLSREYEKHLSIGQRKGGNNINNAWQRVIFIYFGQVLFEEKSIEVRVKKTKLVVLRDEKRKTPCKLFLCAQNFLNF